jgi:hypothetical protein
MREGKNMGLMTSLKKPTPERGRPRGRSGGTPTRATASLPFRSDAASRGNVPPVLPMTSGYSQPTSSDDAHIMRNTRKKCVHRRGDSGIVYGVLVRDFLTRCCHGTAAKSSIGQAKFVELLAAGNPPSQPKTR